MFYRLFSFLYAAPLVLALHTPVHAAVGGSELSVAPGAQITYAFPGTVRRLAIGDPKVAAVTLSGSGGVLITGKAPGRTTLFIWDRLDASRPVVSATVVVLPKLDTQELSAGVSGLRLVMEGSLSSLEAHQGALQKLTPGLEVVDQTSTAFDTQVQIDIKVVEVSRRRLMESGFFLGRNGSGRVAAISGPSSLKGVEYSDGAFQLTSSSGFLPAVGAYNLVLGNAKNAVLGAISMLESNGFAYTLAEPSLTAISGQTATFLAGGEIPIPVSSGTSGTTSIQYKEYGIKVAMTPTVLGPNRIFLKVSPEVSDPDESLTVQSGGVSVPGLSVRRTDTSVALADGESFVLSGLVSRDTARNVAKFPFLAELPVLGAFLRSNRFETRDKELLMVVTANVVRPFAKDQPLPPLPGADLRDYNPSFGEMMFQENKHFRSLTGFSD